MLNYYAAISRTPTVNPETLFQILAPSNHKVAILGADISCRGSTPATTPIMFDWLIQTSAGTATALTGQLNDRGADETIQSTLQKTFTSEPTAGNSLIQFSLHQQGTFPWRPLNGPILVKGGERVGLRYNSGTFVPVLVTVYLQE